MNMLCSRCKKRIAVVYMTRMDNGEPVNEGLCLQCAKELGIQPVDDLMKKMGVNEEELEAMNNQLMDIMGENGEEGFEVGGAQPFPFLQNLFGGNMPKNSGGELPKEAPGEVSTGERRQYANLLLTVGAL